MIINYKKLVISDSNICYVQDSIEANAYRLITRSHLEEKETSAFPLCAKVLNELKQHNRSITWVSLAAD